MIYLMTGVFRRGGAACPQSSIKWIFRGNRLCWGCSLYQKCSVDLKYAKTVYTLDPAGGARDIDREFESYEFFSLLKFN